MGFSAFWSLYSPTKRAILPRAGEGSLSPPRRDEETRSRYDDDFLAAAAAPQPGGALPPGGGRLRADRRRPGWRPWSSRDGEGAPAVSDPRSLAGAVAR